MNKKKKSLNRVVSSFYLVFKTVLTRYTSLVTTASVYEKIFLIYTSE